MTKDDEPRSLAPRAASTAEAAEIELQLAADCARLAELLGFGLAIESDPRLRSGLQEALPAGARSGCVLAFGDTGPYVPFRDRLIVEGAIIAGGAVPDGTPIVRVDKALQAHTDVATAVRRGIETSGAQGQANRLVRAVHAAGHRLTGEDFHALERWAPLLAVDAYRHATHTQMLLDDTRALARSGRTDPALRRHWQRIHALSHTTLLALSASPTTWLVRMSESFEWTRWTPSFPLVRERLGRLTVRGAWAAARFGAGVVEPYLRFVRESQHPFNVFDAVLGTTAIAVASGPERRAIGAELELALRARARDAHDGNARLVFEACLRSASLALHEPDAAMEWTPRRGRGVAAALGIREQAEDDGLARFLALDDEGDGAEIDARGYLSAIVATPTIVAGSAELFFASTSRERSAMRDWKIESTMRLLKRSGRLRLCSCGSGKPSAECCAN